MGGAVRFGLNGTKHAPSIRGVMHVISSVLPAAREVLFDWSVQCPETEEGWMFPNPVSGKPYCSTEIQKRYLKPAGINRCADEGSTGTHASRLYSDHDERVWTGDAGVEERSEWEGCHDGAQALAGERLKCQFSYWE